MSSDEYEYGPDDDIPTGGIPYSEIHPDNDCWPSHSLTVQQTFREEIVPKLPDNVKAQLTNSMSGHHAVIKYEKSEVVPMSVRMPVEMAGWKIRNAWRDRIDVYYPDGPLTNPPEGGEDE